MPRIKNVLFDLDGTITDSQLGIFNSVRYALKKLNWPIPGEEKLRRFIGPPILDAFSLAADLPPELGERAVALYREYYAPRGCLECEVYAGIPALLSSLKTSGFRIGIATSKPACYTEQILDHFDLSRYVDFLSGATLDGSISRKADIVRLCMAKLGAEPDSAVLVGDRHYDIEGAAENGIPCIGVLWGFGSREELTKAGAAALAETPEEIPALLASL